MNSDQDEIQLDTRARDTALDPWRSFIVQAPAGSGKTTVLTERLLTLLLTVDEPEELLAITFTRKAAAEMRKRVIDALHSTQAPAADHEVRAWTLGQRVRERSAQRGWALEQSAGRLRVQTIDALNLGIAAQLPVAARIGGAISVSDDNKEMYWRAAQRLLEDAEADADLRPHVERLLARTDIDWQRLLSTVAAMLPLRSHWLAHFQTDAPGGLRERVQTSLRSVIEAALQRALQCIGLQRLQVGAKVLATAATHIAPSSTFRLDCWRQSAPTLRATTSNLGHWQELARFALVKDYSKFRSQPDVRVGVPAYDEVLKVESRQWLAALAQVPEALGLLADIAQLPPTDLIEDDALALDSIGLLLLRATAILQLLFAEVGRVDHVYVAGAARQALSIAGDPTELALRLGTRIRHILVDEYQDTSVHQVQLLEQLTADWSDGDGRSLFLVGDPMQSIYLFRESDVGLFLRARAGRLGTVRLESLELRRNFRSRPGLVEFTNRCFGRLFPLRSEVRDGAVPFLRSVAARAAAHGDSAVTLHRFVTDDPAVEAACIRDIVNRHLQHSSAPRIAVLTRSKKQAAVISEQLLAAGISVSGIELVPLAEVGVVQDLTALARALRHDGDRIAWLAILRAPWCGLSLQDLEALVAAAPDQTVRELIAQSERWEKLSALGRAQVGRIASVLADPELADPHRPGTQWLESVWRAIGGPAACATDAELVHARRFFDVLARRVAEQGWPDAEEYRGMLERLFAEPAPGVVQIMTIHKAKGLEFDVVIVPGLQRATHASDAPLMRWIEIPRPTTSEHDALTDLLVAPLARADLEDQDPLWGWIARLRRRREQHEQLRLLYVATTRAKESLHLLASLPERADAAPRSGSSLASLWPALREDFLAQAITYAAPLPVSSAGRALRRLPAGWAAPRFDTDVRPANWPVARVEMPDRPQFVWVGQTGRHVGTVLHSELQRAARVGLDLYEAELDDQIASSARLSYMLTDVGVDAAQLDAAIARVRKALRNTLSDTNGRWIVGPLHREAHSEFALSGLHEGKLTQAVVDRWLIDNNGDCWVIDYKTSAHEGSAVDEFIANEIRRYTPQLERYRALSRGLGQPRVRAALYFPLLARLEELP